MLSVTEIPAFDDNYIWLLSREGCSGCAVVDPGDEVPVLQVLEEKKLQLTAILITHKHYDHVGGIAALKRAFPESVVYGPAGENIQGIEQKLGEADRVVLDDLDITLRVMDVPGHTEGHIAYLFDEHLFCGDTLFAGGCGRVFSGTHAQLSASLEKIAVLPEQTRVYCAHEYTIANLGFAQWVEPENPALLKRMTDEAERRRQGLSTVPSLLAVEKQTNPFLRTSVDTVISAACNWAGSKLENNEQVFTALRTWKDKDYD